MLPPDFTKHLGSKGVNPPHCRDCIYVAELDRSMVCMKYGAYVLLCSSCESFEGRIGSDSPIVNSQEVNMRFRSGLNELRK